MKLSAITQEAGRLFAKKHIATANTHFFSFEFQGNADAFALWAARNNLHYIRSAKHAWVCIKMKGVIKDE